MKAIVNLSGIVIDVKHLESLGKILIGAEKRDYDYTDNKCVYYIRPVPSEGFSIEVVPDDLVEAQRLIWKLKEESKPS